MSALLHVVGRVLAPHVCRSDQGVPRRRVPRDRLAAQHAERQRQDVVPITVKKKGHRADEDAASVVGIDLLLVARPTMYRSVTAESDDRGILGINASVPAGPLSGRLAIRVGAAGTEAAEIEHLVNWAVDHCPVADAVRRAVPVDVEIEIA